MERVSGSEKREPTDYSVMELKDNPDLFAEAVAHMRQQLADAPKRVPGESEQVIRSRHMPDRRLTMADQGLQMRIRKAARSFITRHSLRDQGTE